MALKSEGESRNTKRSSPTSHEVFAPYNPQMKPLIGSEWITDSGIIFRTTRHAGYELMW